MIAVLNDLEASSIAIQNAYFSAPIRERVSAVRERIAVVPGPEFGSNQGYINCLLHIYLVWDRTQDLQQLKLFLVPMQRGKHFVYRWS